VTLKKSFIADLLRQNKSKKWSSDVMAIASEEDKTAIQKQVSGKSGKQVNWKTHGIMFQKLRTPGLHALKMHQSSPRLCTKQ
jgi:hypothetical protein